MLPSVDQPAAVTRAPLRVRFCDTDLMGIAHHANYLVYFEAGRVEWLRRRGVTYADWAARGIHLPVVEAHVQFRAPARFDDVLVVETRLVQLRSVSLRFAYRLERGSELLAEGLTRLACVDLAHRLKRFPDEILAILASPETERGTTDATL
jgi:acyl-CoA thioester hydrolase